MFDLNVLLDVAECREPHFAASASVCAMAIRREVLGFIPGHSVTTLAYVVQKHSGRAKEGEVIDWLLNAFRVAPTEHEDMLRARSSKVSDFEDAVVATVAHTQGCRFILTRNVPDFRFSPVPAITPEEYLAGPSKT